MRITRNTLLTDQQTVAELLIRGFVRAAQYMTEGSGPDPLLFNERRLHRWGDVMSWWASCWAEEPELDDGPGSSISRAVIEVIIALDEQQRRLAATPSSIFQ
jgi:hypothetical protein